MAFKIVQGLKTDLKNYTIYDDINEIEELSKANKNCYLVYAGDEEHKIYFDIDLKKEEYEKIGTFEKVKDDILNDFKNKLSPYSSLSIAEANKKDYKISYRIILNDFKMKINDMKIWVKSIKENEFEGYIKDSIDLMPYMSNGKMRLPHSTKEGEDRPMKIIAGKFKDFITTASKNATLLDFTPPDKTFNKASDKINKIVNKHKFNNNKITDDVMTELLNNLDISRSNNYFDWVRVGMALFNDGYDIKLYREFSKRSKKYVIGCEYIKWNQFKEVNNPVSVGSLWYYLSQDNNEKYIELRDKVDLKNYDFKVDLTEDYFNEKKMFDLMINDIKDLGLMEYINRFFVKSKSYQYFNHYFFKVLDNNITFKIEYKGKRKEIHKIDINAFTAFKYTQGQTKFNFVDCWIDSINKQSFSKIDFAPNCNNRPDIFNLFNGYNYQDNEKNYNIEDIQPILNHIKYLCNDEIITYDYVLNWISHIVQKPQRKTETAIVFYSHKEGIGKNIFTTILKKIFDGYVATDMKLDNLVGKFNSSLAGKLLIIADEVQPTAKELNNELKNIITRDEINIEYKGKDAITMKDRANYIFTTNNEMAFRITEEDRRYCMIECPTIKKDLIYFDTLYPLIENDKIIKQFFNYLLTKDLNGIDIRNIPLTAYKKRTQQHNLPHYIKMIIDCPEYFAMKDLNVGYIKTELNNYYKDHGINYRPNITDRRIMMDMGDKFGKYKIKSHGITTYQMPGTEDLIEYINETFGNADEYI